MNSNMHSYDLSYQAPPHRYFKGLSPPCLAYFTFNWTGRMRFGDLLLSMLTSVDNNRLDISKLLKRARRGGCKPFITKLGVRGRGICEFEANLVHVESFKPTMAT